jgi:hypothetical protein
VDHDARLQVPPNQAQNALVHDPPGDPSHEDVMVDPVKAFLQIHVHDPLVPCFDVFLGPSYRLMGVSAGPETEAVLRERWVIDRIQDLEKRLLDEPVHHGGNPQLSGAPAGLRYHHLLDRLGLVVPLEQLFAEPGPVGFQVFLEFPHCHSVYAGTALVRAHSLQCSSEVLLPDHLLHHDVLGGFGCPGCRCHLTRRVLLPAGFTLGLRRPVPFKMELLWHHDSES